MAETYDFDFEPSALDDPTRREFRAKLQALVEDFAQEQGTEGIMSSWVFVGEFCVHEGGAPVRELFVDYADFNQWASVPWVAKGLCHAVIDRLNASEV
jgi:hypothetical protein